MKARFLKIKEAPQLILWKNLYKKPFLLFLDMKSYFPIICFTTYLSSSSNVFIAISKSRYITILTGMAIHMFKLRKYKIIPKIAEDNTILPTCTTNDFEGLIPTLFKVIKAKIKISTSLNTVEIDAPM